MNIEKIGQATNDPRTRVDKFDGLDVSVTVMPAEGESAEEAAEVAAEVAELREQAARLIAAAEYLEGGGR